MSMAAVRGYLFYTTVVLALVATTLAVVGFWLYWRFASAGWLVGLSFDALAACATIALVLYGIWLLALWLSPLRGKVMSVNSAVGSCALLVIGVLAIGFLARPRTIGSADEQQIIAAALESMLQQASYQTTDYPRIYVQVDGADPHDAVLSALRRSFPDRELKPWSLRPRGEPGVIRVVPPALPDDFVAVAGVLFPFWRVAQARTYTSACHGSALLVKLGSTWRVVGYQTDVCA